MCQSCFKILKCGIIELKYCGIRVGQKRTKRANFPLGLAPQKRPPQVIKTWVKCWENSVFLRLVGAFFGEPTQVENCQSPTLTFDMEAKNGQGQKVKILQTKVQIRCEQK